MCAIILPGQVPYKELALETRKGNQIPNSQSESLTRHYEALDKKSRKDYKHNCFRTPGPSAFYNCHGLTFAARRTTIDRAQSVQLILCDDGYKEIEDKNKVLPGDLVLYFSKDDIEHSGMVVEIARLDFGIRFRILSKWGHGSEVLHWLEECPYEFSAVKFYRINK